MPESLLPMPWLLPATRWMLLVIVGPWFATYPAGWLITRLMSGKKKLLEQSQKQDDHEVGRAARGFDDGGAVIGYLERLLIYLFVMSGQLGAVGFLVAAKSIFRFGELSDHNNRLEAEYITIGTLLSFATGLAVAMTFRWVLLGDPA